MALIGRRNATYHYAQYIVRLFMMAAWHTDGSRQGCAARENTMKVLIGLLIILGAQSAWSAEITPVGKVESYVNVRSAPDASADVVAHLNRGETLTHVATVDGWYRVELSDGGEGYVHADWADIVDEQAAPEAVASMDEPVDADEIAPTTAESAASDTVASAEPANESTADVIDTASTEVKAADVEPTVAVDAAPISEAELVEEAPEPKIEPTSVAESINTVSPIKGKKDFLVRFKTTTSGTTSQVYDDGNVVGIGTTSPQQRLEVNGSIQINDQNSGVAGLMITQSSGETGYILHNRASTLTIGAGSVDRLTIDRHGNIGIAVARPTHPLQMASGAHVTAGGVWTNSSSRHVKEGIEPLDAGVATAALAELEPVRFRYRNDSRDTYLGFIAEDVPEIVATSDRQSLSPMDIVALLTRVVQEQERRIAELEKALAVGHN